MFFRNLLNSTETIQEWEKPLYETFVNSSSSGITLTSDSALTVGAIYACVNIKANTIAKLPLQLYKRNKSGRERDSAHAVAQLIEKRPNPYQTPFVFKHTITVHRNLWGNAYIKINVDNRGVINSLTLLDPSKVKVAADTKGKLWYTYSLNGQMSKYDSSEIIHLPYLSTDGINGKSPISIARETASTMKAAQNLAGNLFKNGTLTTSILSTDQSLSPEAKKAVRQAWQDANSGLSNAGKVAVIDSGLSHTSINMSLVDAEYIASQKFSITEIARIFNVPLHMLNELDKSSFSNIEQQSMDFIQNTIQPELVAWEEEMNYKLFTTAEQKKYYVKFNLNSVARGDMASRAAFYEKMLDKGAYSINKVLELEDMDGIGSDGDKHRVDLNHVSIEIADEYQLAKAGASKGGGNGEE
ncbi:phage portal protein [Bacillus infantis]|uniref:phage portal protein n=1 Tax=Bacillus infantis TaxID=324767 RepID=UPI003CFAABAD